MAKPNPLMVPGITDGQSFHYRNLFRGNEKTELPGFIVIDSAQSRDAANAGHRVDILLAGNAMGRITATKKYRPSIIGVSTAAYTSGETTLEVGVAVATEVARLLAEEGGDVTLNVTGPPSAAGTVATIETDASAADTAAGEITITDLGANMIEGAFLQPADGAEAPVGFIFRPDGTRVTDDMLESIDVQTSLAIAGTVDSSQIVWWPTDTSLIAWLKAQLNAAGNFIFDDVY